MDRKTDTMMKAALPIFMKIAEKMGIDGEALEEFKGSTFDLQESELFTISYYGDSAAPTAEEILRTRRKVFFYDAVKVTLIVTKKSGEKLLFHLDFPYSELGRLPRSWQEKIAAVQV